MKLVFTKNSDLIQGKLFFLILLLPLMFYSCFSIKPTATKSGKKHFETFYVGDEGIQYFIKPFLFQAEKPNESLALDFTFRYKNEVKDSATVNFSIKSTSINKNIDSLKLSSKNVEIKSDKINLLFNEKNKSDFISRFTTKLSLKEVKELFNESEWKIIIYNQDQSIKYKPHRKTIRVIQRLDNEIFILM